MFEDSKRSKEIKAELSNIIVELKESVRTCDEDSIRFVRNATTHLMDLHKGNINRYFEDPLRREIDNLIDEFKNSCACTKYKHNK